MSTDSGKSKTKVITQKATLSYPHLLVPQAGDNPGDKAKYSATLVFAPGTDLRELEAAAIEAATKRFGTQYKGKAVAEALRTGTLYSPFRRDAVEKGYPEGSVRINCRTADKPALVYGHLDPATNKPALVPDDKAKEVFYPGAQVRASVAAFAYEHKTKTGVSFALNNIQWLGDGVRLDGRVAAEDEFDAPLSEAPADLKDVI